jgi:ATP-binding cassette, subfamily B, multidrug efflux pump
MSVTGKAFDLHLLTRLLGYVRPYRKTFYISILLTVAIAGLAPLRPWLVQHTFDTHIVSSDRQGLLLMTLIMMALLFVQAMLQYLNTYLTNLLGQDVVKDMRTGLYKRLLSFRLKYFDNTPVGTLITRCISDMETIGDIFAEGLIIIIGDILQLLVVVGFMFYTDWQLTLISLSTIPVLLIATNIFKNGIKTTFNEVRTQVARLNTFVQEHITGMSIVQIFNREEIEMEKFKEINRLHMKAHIRSVWYYSVFFPVVEILSAVSLGLMIWWGAKGVLGDTVSVGNIVAFIMYINMLFRPIRELADKFNTLQMGMVSSERVFKVLDTDASVADKGTFPADGIRGKIEFRNVWFAYNEENWVLKDVSFTVNEGEMLALVGATGAGKTSVINLLTRFYEINKGSILIDGKDIREYSLPSLRSKVSLVLQDVFLFSDTVKNNITLSNPLISDGKVIEAARAVGAHAFIQKLPGSYDYNVQERGATLSAGQRQLISFIRAYVYDPRILVLDEATSSVDSESERIIQEATRRLTSGRTSVVIAHRLATIQNADKILVFDKGEIVEEGTHSGLLKMNGYYRRLYDIQFKEEIAFREKDG